MQSAHPILRDAICKLLELHGDPQWAKQLPDRSPPVLWFGNTSSLKPKVLTLGANPSRQEFLSDSSAQAIEKVRRAGDQSKLSYREPPKNRFHLLRGREELADSLTSKKLQRQIIDSYNVYFTHEPYRTWFGNDRDNSYKVEGFLRGFGASYYDGNTIPFQAIHVDLFPFATLSDFGHIKDMADAALFADGWAQRLVTRLIEFLDPSILVIFGRTNCEYFDCYVEHSVSRRPWQPFRGSEYFIGRSERFGLPVVGISTNLGNPRGFDALGLREYGNRIQQLIKKATIAK